MARHTRRDGGPDALPRASRPQSGRRRAIGLLSSLTIVGSLLLAAATAAVAEPGTQVNIEPESATVVVGQTVTLTAQVRDLNGNPALGPDANTHVRWYFAVGSPNDIDSPGNSADLECQTNSAGECSVSYVAAGLGADAI